MRARMTSQSRSPALWNHTEGKDGRRSSDHALVLSSHLGRADWIHRERVSALCVVRDEDHTRRGVFKQCDGCALVRCERRRWQLRDLKQGS